jgi:hypothetical protein
MAAPVAGGVQRPERISASGHLHDVAREEPGNLSGSRRETHPDSLPADANRCHSLLLDPIG